MKHLRLLLAFLTLMIGGINASAQEDVTATYITNPSFEVDGVMSADNNTEPKMIQPTGWTQEQNTAGSYQNNQIRDAKTENSSNYGTLVTPSDGTYYLFYRHGWNGSNYAKFTSTAVNLPAGSYTLKVDYKMVSGSDNTTNNTNTTITLSAISGESTLGTNSANDAVQVNNNGSTAILVNNEWSTLTTTFSLDEETSTQFVINLLACGPKRSDFVIDNVRLLYSAYIDVTAVSLNESSLSLTVGNTSSLVANLSPENANTGTGLIWTTSDANVAAINNNGVVTAIGPGTATITVTTEGGFTATCDVTVADVSPAAPPAYFSEIGAGDFYIVNAATGKYLGGANDWGTRAGLIEHGIPFTVALNDGKYTLDSHTYNNANDHYLGIADTDKPYVDASARNLIIESVGNGKYSINIPDFGYLTATDTENTIVGTTSTANSVLAQWYFVSKEDRDKLLENVTDANPADATYYLTEANISRNLRKAYNTSGWTGTFSYGGKDVNQCAERYKANTNVYQTITVPNGKYTVSCQGFYRQESGNAVSYLYANDDEVALNKIEAGGINSMSAASDAFTNGQYNNTLTVYVTDGSLTVGIKCDAASNWTIWDNFELYYHGPTIGGEAIEKTDPMEADKWYYFDIAVDGDYNLTTTTLSDIVYTTDGTILIENESTVTGTFGANPVTLTAGRYYVKSASEQTLEVAAASYNYELGNVTLSVADGGYTQSNTFTVTFPNAATNDPDGIAALVASSTATVNGESVNMTGVENGFSLNLGTLTPATDYEISVPAGVYGYATGETYNEVISLTIHTPAVFDGVYCLYNPHSKMFLGRGHSYGTAAVVDKYGVPFTLTTGSDGNSVLKFVDNNGYLFNTYWLYTDGGTPDNFKILVQTIGDYSGYGLYNQNLPSNNRLYYYAKNDNDQYRVAGNATIGDNCDNEVQTVWQFMTVAERDAIIAAYPTENINNVITASGITTTAEDFTTYLANYTPIDCTSSIGTAKFSGSKGDWTWSQVRGEGGQPAYGTNFAEIWCATGSFTQTISGLEEGIYKLTVQGFERRLNKNDAATLYNAGYNLVSTYLAANNEQVRFADWNIVTGNPNSTGGAVDAFNNGEVVNTVYVYLNGTEDLTITIKKPNYIYDCWTIFNNFTLTRYVAPETVTIKSGFTGTTYSSENALDFSSADGLKAYIITGTADGKCITTEVTKVPAGTGVYVEGDPADYTVNVYDGSGYSDVEGNLLVGTGAQSKELLSDASFTYYMFGKQNGKESFFKVGTETPRTASAHKAYLAIPGVSSAKAFVIVRPNDDVVSEDGGFADGINNVEQDDSNAKIYNLNGQRVNNAQKGVYIQNGKKVIIK